MVPFDVSDKDSCLFKTALTQKRFFNYFKSKQKQTFFEKKSCVPVEHREVIESACSSIQVKKRYKVQIDYFLQVQAFFKF